MLFQNSGAPGITALIILGAGVIVTFACLSQAPGLTDEERHQKGPETEKQIEPEVPRGKETELTEERPIIICFIFLIFISMVVLLLAPGSINSGGLAVLLMMFTSLCCCGFILAVGKENQEESGKIAPLRIRGEERFATKSKRRIAKPSTEQLFWQSDGISRPKPKPTKVVSEVKALRGGEIIGGRFRFKVKVLNESLYTINDVTVYILSYPRDTLILKTEDDDVFFSKIESQGFRSPSFDFLPTQDCVRGVITAGVSYVDASGTAHTLTTEPFTIRAVCDLLQPEAISPKGFERKIKQLESGEIVLKVEEWTPKEMQEKTLRVLSDSNFHEVSSEETESDGVRHYKISGWAKGKYTGKNIGAEIFISGVSGRKGASCTLRVAGEDDAMILPAIDDLKERLSAYLCPMCGSKLTTENVEDLKKGKVVCCPFCGVSIGK